MATMIPDHVDELRTPGEERFYRFLEQVAKPDSKYLAWYWPDVLLRFNLRDREHDSHDGHLRCIFRSGPSKTRRALAAPFGCGEAAMRMDGSPISFGRISRFSWREGP